MHIYYIIHYFPPELNGGATRASELAKLWAEAGHQVTILTGFPNHPHGEIPQEYKGKLFFEESKDGYTIRRSYIYATPNKGKVKRIFNHISLTLSTILGSLFKPKPDIIIASSPPLFLGFSGYLLGRLKRVPYVFEVRDIWPQQAIDLGMLTNPFIIRLMERLEMFLYRHAQKVIGVAESTRQILSERGVDKDKLEIIFNGTNPDDFKPGAADELLKPQLGLEGKFVISYIGTMGLSQGLMVVLKAAQQLEDKYPQIHFLLVGHGAEREILISAATTMGLNNVTFLKAQPRTQIPDLYRLSDISLVVLRNLPLFYHTIPSKIFEIMACQIPVILGVAGEMRTIIEAANAGLCIEPENEAALKEAILKLYHAPELKNDLAVNGRVYVEKHYNRRELAQRYLSLMEGIS